MCLADEPHHVVPRSLCVLHQHRSSTQWPRCHNLIPRLICICSLDLSAENIPGGWTGRGRLTNSGPSRVHRVTQPTLLHQALHVGNLFRHGCRRGTNLIHHESRLSCHQRAPCLSTQLTYGDETKVCNAGLRRLERSRRLSHYYMNFAARNNKIKPRSAQLLDV